MALIPLRYAAEQLGVCPKTVRNWLKEGTRVMGNRMRASNGVEGWYSGSKKKRGLWLIDPATLPTHEVTR